jgi:hypothetical protein
MMATICVTSLLATGVAVWAETGETRGIRLICSLTSEGGSGLTLTIENVSSEPLDTLLTARVILEDPRGPTPFDPLARPLSYRAPLDLTRPAAAPARDATRLRLPPSGSASWPLVLGDLLWHATPLEAGSTGRPFRTVVPPGRYDITVVLDRADIGRWRSGHLLVEVNQRGRIIEVHSDPEETP